MASQSVTPYRSPSTTPMRPASPLASFYREASRLFEDVFRDFDEMPRDMTAGMLVPKIDVVQKEHETCITAELPGVKQEDVDVSVDHDVLTIRAEKRSEKDEDKSTRHIRERSYGMFQRSLRLQQPVDPDQVKAHFDSGVLTVVLPQNEQDNARRKIQIASGPAPDKSQQPAESRH